MSDHDDEAEPLEPPPTDEELRAAEALRSALEQTVTADPRSRGDADRALFDLALRARATAGPAVPLSEATRRAAIDDALRATIDSVRRATIDSAVRATADGPRRATPQRTAHAPRGHRLWLAAAVLLVAFIGGGITLRRVGEPATAVARNLPDDGYARPTDALFNGGLQPEQRASARLDAIVNSRTRGYFAVVAADLAERGEPR